MNREANKEIEMERPSSPVQIQLKQLDALILLTKELRRLRDDVEALMRMLEERKERV